MKHSYGKIICFQNFPFGKGLWLTYRYLTKSLSDLKWGRRIFSIGFGSLVREEFLKQPVGNSNTYDLKLENAMSGEFNVMIVQTLETWTKWATLRSFIQLILDDKNPQHSLKQKCYHPRKISDCHNFSIKHTKGYYQRLQPWNCCCHYHKHQDPVV